MPSVGNVKCKPICLTINGFDSSDCRNQYKCFEFLPTTKPQDGMVHILHILPWAWLWTSQPNTYSGDCDVTRTRSSKLIHSSGFHGNYWSTQWNTYRDNHEPCKAYTWLAYQYVTSANSGQFPCTNVAGNKGVALACLVAKRQGRGCQKTALVELSFKRYHR